MGRIIFQEPKPFASPLRGQEVSTLWLLRLRGESEAPRPKGFYIVPLDPSLKGGACGALAGERFFITLSNIRVEAVQDLCAGEPL